MACLLKTVCGRGPREVLFSNAWVPGRVSEGVTNPLIKVVGRIESCVCRSTKGMACPLEAHGGVQERRIF